MATNRILAMIDDPAERAFQLERRRVRRRNLAIFAAVAGVVLLAIGWKVGRHLLASTWMEANQYQVIWGVDKSNWKSGGVTSVKFVQKWNADQKSFQESDIESLTWLHRVEELNLSTAGGVNDDNLRDLPKLSSLRVLNLDRMLRVYTLQHETGQLTDATLARIESLPLLEELNLSGQRITDAGLAHLAGLTRLKHLSFRDTDITDAGLEHLKALPNLKSVELIGTKVTPEAVKKFEAARPGIIITIDSDIPIPPKPMNR